METFVKLQRQMTSRGALRCLFVALLGLVIGSSMEGATFLDEAKPSDNERDVLGKGRLEEYEKRLFSGADWIARVIVYTSEGDIDRAIEIYKDPTAGTPKLGYRTAHPSLTNQIYQREVFGLKSDLGATAVNGCDIPISSILESEIRSLFTALLPGKPPSPPRVVHTHMPIVICMTKGIEGNLLAGQVGMNAYLGPKYMQFRGILGSLVKLCSSTDERRAALLKAAESKVRRLRVRVQQSG